MQKKNTSNLKVFFLHLPRLTCFILLSYSCSYLGFSGSMWDLDKLKRRIHRGFLTNAKIHGKILIWWIYSCQTISSITILPRERVLYFNLQVEQSFEDGTGSHHYRNIVVIPPSLDRRHQHARANSLHTTLSFFSPSLQLHSNSCNTSYHRDIYITYNQRGK